MINTNLLNIGSSMAGKEFPYDSDQVPFILVRSDGQLEWASDRQSKYQLVTQGEAAGTVIATWHSPSSGGAAVYHIDRDQARNALNI